MPISSGESIATVVARASRKPCGLTERPNAARVWRVIRRWAWVGLMPRFCSVSHKAGQGGPARPGGASCGRQWARYASRAGTSGAGKGRAIGTAGLGLRGRDLEPPAGAAPLELPAELEADEVGQPQRPVGETGDHQAVAVEPGPHARPQAGASLGLRHQPATQPHQLVGALQAAALVAHGLGHGRQPGQDALQPGPRLLGRQPAQDHRQALQRAPAPCRRRCAPAARRRRRRPPRVSPGPRPAGPGRAGPARPARPESGHRSCDAGAGCWAAAPPPARRRAAGRPWRGRLEPAQPVRRRPGRERQAAGRLAWQARRHARRRGRGGGVISSCSIAS